MMLIGGYRDWEVIRVLGAVNYAEVSLVQENASEMRVMALKRLHGMENELAFFRCL